MDNVKKIDTPYNKAVAIINRTNQLLLENNIKDSTGEAIAQLEETPANPAWLFALACGQLHTSWQEALSKAYSALDPQNCEDDQVLVLASLAGIKRGNGTPSHITVLIENTSDESLTVPFGTTFTESYVNQTWVLNKNINLLGKGKQYATLFTTTDGEYIVPSGTDFNYSGELSITCVSTSSSSGGSSVESISSLRNRISQGEDSSNFVNQTKVAIELLSGIESCSIWVNSSSTESLVIGSGTSSRITVNITNTSGSYVIVPIGTIFTDNLVGKKWTLKNELNIKPNGQTSVTLYTVNGEDVIITNGTTFTYSGPLTITCAATSDSTVGSITIPPRNAYISIKGYDYSGKIAETYYSYLNIPATVGNNQEQCLVGQQPLTVNFNYSEEAPVNIYVTMKASDMAVGAEGAIKNAVSAHSGTLACGENVTSQMVSEWVQNFEYGTVVDCSVGSPSGMISNISPTEYCIFNDNNIVVTTI